MNETLIMALQHHQAGNLGQAAQLYRAVLQQNPEQIDALQLLGMIASQNNNYELAIECFSKAVNLHPASPSFHYNLANAWQKQGKYEKAIVHYQQALKLNPNYIEAHNNLGITFQQQGNLAAAIPHYQQALALQPNAIEIINNLGMALQEQRRFDEAIALYQQALLLQPGAAEIHNNLGVVLQEQQRFPEAITHYQQALSLAPDAKIHNNLGVVLRKQQQLDAAISHYQQALTLQPRFPEAHTNLANALREQDRLSAALSHYQQALVFNRNCLDAHINLGVALIEKGRLQTAINHYQQPIALNQNPTVHYNLSMALLLSGDYQQGFAEYEWRWQKPDTTVRHFSQPLWDGSRLQGKTILLHAEQGFGDQIQFIRYVPLVAQFQGQIVVECAPSLIRLFTNLPEISQLVAPGETPLFDVHAPLMSLPWILGTTLKTVPASIPYLYPPTSIPVKLETPSSQLKVGIVWAGNPLLKGNPKRSCPLSYFLPLLEIPNITWFSLQTGPKAEELQLVPTPIQDLSVHFHDFADTAAIVAQLDLVITIDTAVAHLAGALGKPTWVLLPFAPDWRWMLKRQDSPWYSTMRLFRQPQPGDWQGVLAQVQQELTLFPRKSAITLV